MKNSLKLFIAGIFAMFSFAIGVSAADVAQIDTTKFETLQKAIDAAKVGETIKLIEDIDLELGDGAVGFTVAKDDEITLDLNGHAITGPGAASKKSSHIIVNKGKLTIMDSSADGSGKIEMSTTTEWNIGTQATPISNQGILVVNSGTIANYRQTTTMAYAIDTNSGGRDVKTTINGGFIYSDYCALRAFSNSNEYKAEIEINGGEVKSANRPIFMQNLSAVPSIVKITGGKITSTQQNIFYIWDDTEKKEEVIGITNVDIRGGVFTSAKNSFATLDTVEENIKETANFEITAGTFNLDVIDYVSDTYVVKSENGKYIVVENTVIETTDEKVSFESEEALPNNFELVVEESSEEDVKEAAKEVTEEFKDNKKVEDVKLLALYEINVEKNGVVQPMEDGNFKISIEIDEDLQKYDAYKVVYINDEGKVEETLDAKLVDGKIVFETTHLSTYGIVGYNNVEVKNPETGDNVVTYILVGLMSLVAFGYASNKLRKNA